MVDSAIGFIGRLQNNKETLSFRIIFRSDFNNLRKALSELTNGTEDDVNRSYEELAEYVNTILSPGGKMDVKK